MSFRCWRLANNSYSLDRVAVGGDAIAEEYPIFKKNGQRWELNNVVAWATIKDAGSWERSAVLNSSSLILYLEGNPIVVLQVVYSVLDNFLRLKTRTGAV